MRICNGTIWRDGAFGRGDLAMADGLFVEPCTCGRDEALDAEGLYVIPGLIDIHTHGCGGADFSGPRPAGTLATMASALASAGTTAFCAATMAMAPDALEGLCTKAATFEDAEGAAAFLGVNLEGLFLSPARAGAHSRQWLVPPSLPLLGRLMAAAGGRMAMVTVSPELPGAAELIACAARETVVALGHTQGGYDAAVQGFDAGARLATHLWNAMAPPTAREPGIMGAAADRGAYVELICDGIHVHPANVRAVFRLFGPRRVVLVSDGTAPTGLGDGSYTLGGSPVTVCGRRATLRDGTLAGSVSTLLDCLRQAAAMGIPLEAAVGCATQNPAQVLGLTDRGAITPGKVADLVLLDSALGLRQVFVRGVPILPTGR